MLSSKPDLWENLNACIHIQIGSLKSRQKNKEGALKQSGTQQRADSKYQSRNSKKMAFHGCLKGIIWVWIFLKNAIIWWRWSQAVSRGAWGGLQESTDGWNKLNTDPAPWSPFSEKAAVASHGGQSDMSGQRAGGSWRSRDEWGSTEWERAATGNPCGDIRNRARDDNLVIASAPSL